MEDLQFVTAVHILTVLALHEDEPQTSTSLANSVNTNPVVIRRMMKLLSDAGLLQTTRGRQGGVVLAKKAKQISMSEVYQAVHPKSAFACNKRETSDCCPIGKNLFPVFAKLQQDVDMSIENSLKKRTLEDIIGDIGK